MNFRKQPLRLEMSLTRDYINRAEKLKEIERRITRSQVIHWAELAAYWVLLGILITFVLLNW